MSDRQNVCSFAALGTWWCLTNAVVGVQWQTRRIFAYVMWSTYKLTHPSIPSVCWHHSDIRTYQVIQTNVTVYWLLSMHVAYVTHSFWWLQWDIDVSHPPPSPPLLPWSARTIVASHESPSVVSVHSHHHCFLNVFTAPHQNVVDPSPYGSSWSSFTFHHPEHQWLQQSVVRHSAHMA